MDCSVIIVSYNTFSLTLEAVASAFAGAGSLSCEVVVVDNASPDGSASRLRHAFAPEAREGRFTLIENAHNVGFSAANNQGAAASRGTTLHFFNPDTVTHAPALETLHHFLMGHPEAGAAGPHVLNTDGSDQGSVRPWPTLTRLVHFYLPLTALLNGNLRRHDALPASTSPVDSVSGCALSLRRDAFEAVGGWDERLFMYAEEDVLCRALQQAGYTNYFVREACVTHHGGASTQPEQARFEVMSSRNALAFRRAHFPHLVLPARVLGVLGYGLRSILFTVQAHRKDDPLFAARAAVARALFRWYLFSYQ